MFKVPERYRITDHPILASSRENGNNGAFEIPTFGATLFVIASDGLFWEHVSVHSQKGNAQRIPSWNEMCQVKNLFWDEDDVVIQFHPGKKNYINRNPYVLHLWRKTGQDWETPPTYLIG